MAPDTAIHWRSVTPFLASGHLKAAGYAGEIRRLLKRRGLDGDEVEVGKLDSIDVGGSPRRAIHFHRFRSRGREVQPDAAGALLDIVPEMEQGCELALLEELDRLREPVRVVPVGTWKWPPDDAELGSFSGWCVHGPGLLPTYYWVDGAGTVAVVSGLFQTWVISAAGDAT